MPPRQSPSNRLAGWRARSSADPELQEQMERSIEQRCETVRGTHRPSTGRVVVWNSHRANHLGQRSIRSHSKGRTYGCKRSDPLKKLLCHGGRPHMGPGLRRDDTEIVAPPVNHTSAFSRHELSELCSSFRPHFAEGAGKAGCRLHPWARCNKKHRGRTTGVTGNNPAFPARWVTAYTCSPR